MHGHRRYRLVAFDGMKPPRPGLVDSENGAAIELEIWDRGSRGDLELGNWWGVGWADQSGWSKR